MKSIKLEFQEKADISEAIATGKLVAFNKSGVSFVQVRMQKGQNYSINNQQLPTKY